ncbi:hypothetical protein N665_0286s0047 [Sinapis alba]|nr:hypothetical protein N665_0286s0047 [Sinapis alba]
MLLTKPKQQSVKFHGIVEVSWHLHNDHHGTLSGCSSNLVALREANESINIPSSVGWTYPMRPQTKQTLDSQAHHPLQDRADELLQLVEAVVERHHLACSHLAHHHDPLHAPPHAPTSRH